MKLMDNKGGLFAYIFWIFIGICIGVWLSVTFL